jgi:hypothetical protein
VTASAPLAAFLSSNRLPLASPLQEAGLENRVPGKSAALTDNPSDLPALTFPDVLGDLVETSEPAAPLKEDAAPRDAKPAGAGRSFLGAATRGGVRNSQLCQGQPRAAAPPASLAVATTTVTLPVAAARPQKPVAGTSMAPETTSQDLARVAAAEALWSQPARLSPALAMQDGLSTAASSQAAAPDGYSAASSRVTAPEAQYRSAKGSHASGGSQATASPTPGEEDAPSVLDPAAALAGRSTVPAPRQNAPSDTQPATTGAAQPSSLASPALGALADRAEDPEMAQLQQPPATLRKSETLPAAQPRLPSKGALDQMLPTPAGQPTLEKRLFAATATSALFQATSAASTRHSAATPIQSALLPGALEAAPYGARDLWEPAAQSGGGKAAELAFGVRLVPTGGPLEAPASDQPNPPPVSVTTPARPSATAPLDGAVPEPASGAAATPLEPVIGQSGDTAEESSSQPAPLEKGEGDALERSRKSETPVPASWETSSGSAARLSPDTAYAPAVRLANASNQPEHSAVADPQPAAAPEPSAGAEPSKPPAAARNIQLDVNSGDGRVEVRLTERGGEVEVAVRTPDARLAGALREDLPALSSRLAESGFRAETWHPASPGASTGVPSGPADWHKLTEPSPGGTPQDPNSRSRQDGGQPHGDSQPRQPKTSEQQPNRKDQGKDFAWLMSSLR